MKCVQAEHLSKAYGGHTVLQDVSFTAPAGAVTCITGPSGVGKTTLVRILLGLERPDSGRVVMPAGLSWGAVFQEHRLLEQLDGLGNLRFALGRAYDAPAARALLERLGLGAAAEQTAASYSGGMKRRLALARALLSGGDALILDEPFAGLDVENRAAAVSCIRDYGAGKIVVLAVHDLQDLSELQPREVALEPPTKKVKKF